MVLDWPGVGIPDAFKPLGYYEESIQGPIRCPDIADVNHSMKHSNPIDGPKVSCEIKNSLVTSIIDMQGAFVMK